VRFYFERPGREAVKLAWGHGRYLDAWSFVHLISGLLSGIAVTAFGLPLWLGLLIILVAALLYEGLEMALGIIENIGNVIADIVLAVLGTAVAYWLFGSWDFRALAIAFAIFAALNLTLVSLGWRHHLRGLFREKNGRSVEPAGEAASRSPGAGGGG
jgi:hypothetical protein